MGVDDSFLLLIVELKETSVRSIHNKNLPYFFSLKFYLLRYISTYYIPQKFSFKAKYYFLSVVLHLFHLKSNCFTRLNLYPYDMNAKKIFGDNLHFYRKQAGLSQEQLAEKLDISVKHLSTLETGKVFVSAELLEKISLVLKVSLAALFYAPSEKSIDSSDYSKICNILEEEFKIALSKSQERIFHLT